MSEKRLIGVAPLSVLGTEPAVFIEAAKRAGFDFIGLRTRPVTNTETDLNLLHGNARLKETLAALRDTGIRVLDTEFLAVNERVTREDWLPMLEAAQALGASGLTVTVTDPDVIRAADTVSRLAEDGRSFGIDIAVEPISYQTIQQLQDGAAFARQTGSRVLLDTLHFHRAFCDLAQIDAALPDLAGLVQLCDGVLADRAGTREGLIEESRSHRYVPGEGDFALAECLARVPADMPVSVEVPNPLFAQLGLDAYLARLLEATRRVVAQADQLRGR